MLAGKGFKKVYNVSGGIKAWQSKIAIGPQDLGLSLFTGSESPAQVLKVAYSLEQGLRQFYLEMEEKASNPAVKDLFAKLSDIEVKHQMSIYLAYNDVTHESVNKEEFERMVTTRALEGGLSNDEYIDLFSPDLSSEVDVISLAMSIEAQALDLYQRVADRVDDEDSRGILHQIANEEKAHLKSLGKLMDSL